MEIIRLVLVCISLLLSIIILIMFVTSNKSKKMDGSDYSKLGEISTKIDTLKESNKQNIELTIAKEMNTLKDANKQNTDDNVKKIDDFERAINQSINNRFDALNEQIDKKFIEINKKVDEKIGEGFKTTTNTMADVRERLQAIDVAQKNIEKLSGDVVSLKSVLENNQSRGKYGEFRLEMILNSVFGDTANCFKLQYTIKKAKDGDDVRADAVVFMPEPNKMICVDSKFPFSDYEKLFDEKSTREQKEIFKKQFNNAVKKHITDIKNKYIIENKTADEAIMFIPNDGIFAYIYHESEEVVKYARDSRVILTSPSTLPAILTTINAVRIQVERAKNAKLISDQLVILGKQFKSFDEEWNRFSNQLTTVTKTQGQLDKRVDTITGKFKSISGANVALENNNPEENKENEN